MMKEFFEGYAHDLSRMLGAIDTDQLAKIAEIVNTARIEGAKLLFMGNGGSSATASHSAADWTKELGIKGFCLTDNVHLVTAISNDISYDKIFEKQLEYLLAKGDIVLAYSGSGNSRNVINGVSYAKKHANFTIGMTGDYNGNGGGELARIADLAFVVPTKSMERIEDGHLIVNHVIKQYIKHSFLHLA